MSALRWLPGLAGFVLLLGGCQWRDAEEFRQELRCGMAPQEVEVLARGYGVETFRRLDEPRGDVTHVLNEKYTFFHFYFGENGLEIVLQGTHKGLTGSEYGPRLNVCTGERKGSLRLTIKAAEELAGAAILVDGKEVARLSSGPGYEANIGLASGAHEIRVEKAGFEDIVVPVDYGFEVTEDTIWIGEPAGEP